MAHDLCGNEVRLDYDLMLRTANIAVQWAKVEIEREMGTLRQAEEDMYHESLAGGVTTHTIVAAKHAAESLERAANQLKVAVDTQMTLYAMQTREEFTIRNHPYLGS
jgi:hypothetical protein